MCYFLASPLGSVRTMHWQCHREQVVGLNARHVMPPSASILSSYYGPHDLQVPYAVGTGFFLAAVPDAEERLEAGGPVLNKSYEGLQHAQRHLAADPFEPSPVSESVGTA